MLTSTHAQSLAHGAKLFGGFVAMLLVLVLVVSSVEVVWGEARSAASADVEQTLTASEPVSDVPGGFQAPASQSEQDSDCPCLCACLCAGQSSAVVPALVRSDMSGETLSFVLPTPDRLPASHPPEPLLRPPLL